MLRFSNTLTEKMEMRKLLLIYISLLFLNSCAIRSIGNVAKREARNQCRCFHEFVKISEIAVEREFTPSKLENKIFGATGFDLDSCVVSKRNVWEKEFLSLLDSTELDSFRSLANHLRFEFNCIKRH